MAKKHTHTRRLGPKANTRTPKKPVSSTKSMAINPKKGIFTEYIDRALTPQQLIVERQKQLKRISTLREGRAILVYAADIQKANIAPISIDYSDLTPINDQISVLEGKRVDLILETGGGMGEVAEDIVTLLRSRFDEVNIIIPGTAKSAGTIIAMAADEILMETVSSLGPIDAQIGRPGGKQFSADAFIAGLEAIKTEVSGGLPLNQAYIPILQNISPGEIQHAHNAMDFARRLVRDWLIKYKFKNWKKRKRDGSIVTDQDRFDRATQIADALSNHSEWKTHARSIKINDLRNMELEITDYSDTPDLADAIRRYRVLVEMTFSTLPAYKLFETDSTLIMRFVEQRPAALPGVGAVGAPGGLVPLSGQFEVAEVNLNCGNCNTSNPILAGIGKPAPKKAGFRPFPADDKLKCTKCGNILDLRAVRTQFEGQFQKKVY